MLNAGETPQANQAKRFSFLANIATEENWPIQSDAPTDFQRGGFSVQNEEAYIQYIRRQAKWLEPNFRKLLMSIVDWAANKRFEVSKFKFKFPRARTSELYRARSRLYQSQILRVNMRLKALAEIYTMHSLALL